MPFDVDIVVLSNIDKNLGPGIEMRVGLPSKNPWSLPFAHKTLFAERANKYDVFVYSEDDILITEAHLRAFLDVTAELADDELAGFLRIEKRPDGRVSFPDVHWNFHWEPQSLKSRGEHLLARFTNEHAACYVLTREQLAKAISSAASWSNRTRGSTTFSAPRRRTPTPNADYQADPDLPPRGIHGPPSLQQVRRTHGRG